ncbi:hypothetical protein FQA39_LY05923 [Lamprigera yunnana]|nr:hypothetical protein FQA39_LY05923 [Lamprigera yunnana]
MAVECKESSSVKTLVTVNKTFSFCGKYGDYGNEELKSEPIDFEEPFNDINNENDFKKAQIFSLKGQ